MRGARRPNERQRNEDVSGRSALSVKRSARSSEVVRVNVNEKTGVVGKKIERETENGCVRKSDASGSGMTAKKDGRTRADETKNVVAHESTR